MRMCGTRIPGELERPRVRAPQTKKTRHQPRFLSRSLCSGGANGCRLQAFGAVADFEFYALIFSQGAETVALNFAEMGEQVVTTTIGSDETEAFSVIEPFNDASLSTHFYCVFQSKP